MESTITPTQRIVNTNIKNYYLFFQRKVGKFSRKIIFTNETCPLNTRLSNVAKIECSRDYGFNRFTHNLSISSIDLGIIHVDAKRNHCIGHLISKNKEVKESGLIPSHIIKINRFLEKGYCEEIVSVYFLSVADINELKRRINV